MIFSYFPTCAIFSFAYNIVNALPFDHCQIVDLTHEFSPESTLYWDGREKFELNVVHKGIATPDKYYYEAYKIENAEHGGTHMDAPSHFNEHGSTIEKVNLTNVMGPACVVDVSNRTAKNKDYQLTVNDLKNWEIANGKFDLDCIVLMRTDWDKKYSNRSIYFGSETPVDPKTYHFPGLSRQAAEWLISGKKIKMFGLDTPSVDCGQSPDFIVHRILSANEIPGLENLMNLDQLPAKGATIIALPMKVKSGSGGPARVIALLGC